MKLAVESPQSLTPEAKKQVILQLEEQLKKCKTASDSVPVLFNLFDITLGKTQTDYGFRLFYTATRAGKETVAFDALRNLANYNMRNDSILQITENLIRKFPVTPDQQHTLTFIRIMRNNCAGYHSSSERKAINLQELLRDTSDDSSTNLYDRIVALHALCVNLSDITEGELLSKYITDLGKLIQETPTSDRTLRDAYYVWSSAVYTQIHQQDQAIDACKKLLEVIATLDERNQKNGRIYRNYAPSRYIIYTRLLENYEGLSPEEIEQYYSLAMEQVANDPKAASTNQKAPLPDIFYAYAKNDYQKVFDLISSCKDEPYLSKRKLQLANMYIEAAENLNDRDALLQAYPIYVKILEEEMLRQRAERMRELELISNIYEFKNENAKLQHAQQEARHRAIYIYAYVAIGVMLLLTVFLFILWHLNRRRKRLAGELKTANESLSRESQSLRRARTELEEARDKAREADALKTEFITNMRHEVTAPLQKIQEYAEMIVENTEGSTKKYISTFADRLYLNCGLVNTIINDVLQLSELSNSSLTIAHKPYDVKPICEAAADTIASRLAPGVTFRLVAQNSGSHERAEKDFILETDRTRLIQILENLLSNAAKFTTEGDVTLTYGKSADGSQAVFTVTDTGCGIDPRHHSFIFERFTKIDSSTPGAGLGLTIARMLAELLGGTLIIDPAYTNGARFILTLPLHQS